MSIRSQTLYSAIEFLFPVSMSHIDNTAPCSGLCTDEFPVAHIDAHMSIRFISVEEHKIPRLHFIRRNRLAKMLECLSAGGSQRS